MKDCCGSCKYCQYDAEYLYPFKCMKDKGKRYSKSVFDERILQGYKCDKFEFRWGETDESK